MQASRRLVPAPGYSVHEMQTTTGVLVREFVSSQGKVFAVSWQGPVRPDLQQLLGSYYDEYAHNAPTRRSHGPITIETPNIVIQFGGHQRMLTGRAYLPNLLPDGVALEGVR